MPGTENMVMDLTNGRSSQWKPLVPPILLVLAIFMVYVFSLDLPFLKNWDDPDHVTMNGHLSLTLTNLGYWWQHQVLGIFMPMTMYSYMVDHFFWGVDPLGYRLQNLFWHAFSAVMFFHCCRFFRVSTWIAFAAVLIWAIHPQRVESVVWLSERKDVLCSALFFSCIYLYLRGMTMPRMKYAAYGVFLLALLCKPMAVSLPFIILIIEIIYQREWRPKYYLRCFLPWLAAALVLMLITMHLQVISKGKELHILRQLEVVFHNLGWYFTSSFFSSNLSPIYPRINFSPVVITMLVFFYGASALGIYLAYRRLSRDKFWFVLLPLIAIWLFTLAPVVGVFQIGFIDRADRYNYIPSAEVWFGVALLLNYLWIQRNALLSRLFLLLVPVTFFYVGWLIFININYLDSWHDFGSLVRVTCDRPNPSNIAIIELGLMNMKEQNNQGLFQVASMFRENKLPWMSPVDHEGQELLAVYFEGVAMYNLGMIDDAIKSFSYMSPKIDHHSLAKKGIFEDAMVKLFLLYSQKGEKQKAVFYLERLLNSYNNRDKNFQYYFYNGVYMMGKKDYSAAVESFHQALKLSPDDANVMINLRAVEDAMKENAAK